MALIQKKFGFREAASSERDQKVQGVFSSVASRYDIMNDVMSGGLHRIWKDRMVSEIHPKSGFSSLDVAGGTGDIAFRIAQKARAQEARASHERAERRSIAEASKPEQGTFKITVCDRNPQMLEVGRARAIDRNIPNLTWVEGDAQALPFNDNQFDYYTISFGLRNVTRISDALAEAYRVLKPGGKFLCLEFSPEVGPEIIRRIYDVYSMHVIPAFGEKITGDRDAYQYLVESIRVFPRPKELVKQMQAVGFTQCKATPMTFGVVCLHTGYKC